MATPIRILLTGFESFGQHTVNPSELVVWEISAIQYEELVIDNLVLPVSFHRAIEILRMQLNSVHYDYVLSLGLAAKRECISLERVAINCMDGSNPDIDGCCVRDEWVVSDGPAAYFTTFPIKSIKIQLDNISTLPCKVSNTAGTFVCNAVFYATLHFAAQSGNTTRCGFVHLPSLQRMSLKEMVKCIDVIIKNLK